MNATGLYVVVAGRVQGVGFRAYTQRQALQENVTGIAKNLADGRVEIRLYGNEANIARVKEAIRIGPPASKVEDLQSKVLYDTALDGFHIE